MQRWNAQRRENEYIVDMIFNLIGFVKVYPGRPEGKENQDRTLVCEQDSGICCRRRENHFLILGQGVKIKYESKFSIFRVESTASPPKIGRSTGKSLTAFVRRNLYIYIYSETSLLET
ncbi:hypothetical protein L6164_006095 [Bauhinia variegata]|uniref:Uncharacterized protein n=1 Tax=Bauhinia variegata TaxID=167791 RepID=A0ACB9PSN2_BAUVA|nr:hypothetical protein L6164_006095 [Bauhinia variegata]